MKKVSFFLLILLLPFTVHAISAASAIVMDLNNNRIYYENNVNDKRLIASTTKIMTAIVAIENADLDMKVTVGEEVLKAYGSAIYIEIGEELTLRDLLLGLMLRSGNDAAIVIAKAVAGNMANFAYLMNQTAHKIGMENTFFYNAHGLEEDDGKGNISTAYDMALLTKYAYQNKAFREIFGTKSAVVKSNTKTYSWTSKNKLIHRYDFITGGKTGYTEKARRTLVTTAEKDNIALVIVTLNDPNDFQDHITLYNQVFNEFHAQLVLAKNNFKIKGDKYYQNQKLYILNDVYIPLRDGEEKSLKINYVLTKKEPALDGDEVGKAQILLKNKVIHEEKIFLKSSQTKPKKSWWQKLLGWFKW